MKYAALLTICLLTSAWTQEAIGAAQASLYDLSVALVDQDSKSHSLNRYQGHPVIVAMFYGSCPNACPLLIESIRATENALSSAVRNELRVLMISIDPQRDTPTALSKLAKERHVDMARWTLATVSLDDVRAIAAALNVQYRRLPNGEYNHASLLTVLSKNGAIGKQTSVLGRADGDFVTAVTTIAAAR